MSDRKDLARQKAGFIRFRLGSKGVDLARTSRSGFGSKWIFRHAPRQIDQYDRHDARAGRRSFGLQREVMHPGSYAVAVDWRRGWSADR